MAKVASEILRGAIVLVPFPFTDLSSIKVRPALVISHNNKGKADLVVVFISSVMKKIHEDEVLLNDDHADFKKTGLKMTSIIKCRKVATLDRSIVLGELGILSPSTMKHVDALLKKILRL
jgi:mRNA interferase MazF